MLSPLFTAKGRRSTCRGRSASSMRVGTVESWTTGWAIQPRGSAITRARRASSSSRVARGPMTMPLPPEPSTGLTTSSSSRSSTSSRAVVLLEPPGVDVGDDRVLAQVVADQVGHVGVDQLVVGDAVADGVGQGDPARPDGVDQPGHAEHRVAAEEDRVEEVVVEAAVDDVDAAQPGGRAHVDLAAPALQVAALHELDAHGPGEQGVLEVGRVVDPRGEHDDVRVVGDRRGLAQRLQQPRGVVRDRADALVGERVGQRGDHRGAVRHHVRDAARHPEVVLEHPDVALGRTDQVDPRHVDADAVGRADAPDHPVEVRRGGDQLARDDAVADDLGVGVDVVEERLHRPHPLGDAGLDRVPLGGRDHPRHEVQRERSLDAADVEGHPGLRVVAGQRLGDALELGRASTAAASRSTAR